MWANFGRESEARDEARRVRGRRHAPRSEINAAVQPTYMSAPFATTEEAPRVNLSRRPQNYEAPAEMEKYNENNNYGAPEPGNNSEYARYEEERDYQQYMRGHEHPEERINDDERVPEKYMENAYDPRDYEQPNIDPRQYSPPQNDNYAEPEYAEIPNNREMYGNYNAMNNNNNHNHNSNIPLSTPASQVHTPPPAGLRRDRTERGGLNIFTWNTDAPIASAPRVQRTRDENELQRLHPLDAHAQRDREVREKFEGNTNSRFLCFSETEKNRQRGGPAVAPSFSAIPAVPAAATAPRFGRRRNNSDDNTKVDGIAGFAGMGSRDHARPYHISRKPQPSHHF